MGNSSKINGRRTAVRAARANKSHFEPLEGRRYLSLGDLIGLPILNLDIPGDASTTVVSATVKQLTIKATGSTGFDRFSAPFTLVPPATVQINVLVNNDGTFNNGVPGPDLLVYQDNDNSGGFNPGDTQLMTAEISDLAVNNVTVDMEFNTDENSGPWSTSLQFFGTGLPNALNTGVELDLIGPSSPPLDFNAGFSGYVPKGELGSLPTPQPFTAVKLSGFVYDDCAAVATSNNGIFDAGEHPIQNATVQLFDQTTNTLLGTTTTDINGFYQFTDATIHVGETKTYSIHEIQPAGYLDGKDTVGTLGGSNAINDTFTNITVTGQSGGSVGENYNFGELDPASLSGFVYDDLNDNGIFESPTEEGIPGVTVTLSGSNDLGPIVPVSAVTDANGAYSFPGLRPGTYVLTETQPAGFSDGKDTIGTQGGTTTNDQFSNIQLACGVNGIKNNFGENGLLHNQTATIGFWRNKNGQQLINDFNASTTSQVGTSKSLGNWLATNFPKMYSGSTNPNNMAGKTTAQVAARFSALFSGTQGMKLDCQVLGTCLSIYATTKELNSGSIGQAFAIKHFFILSNQNSAANLRNRTWNVGNNGEAFATKNAQGKYVSADNQSLTIWTLLQRTNSFAVNGVLWANAIIVGTTSVSSAALRAQGNGVFSAINEAGDIKDYM